MPVLSIDYSQGAASAILINDNLTYQMVRVPLMNPDIFYAHKVTPLETFKNLLKTLEEQFKISITKDFKIFASTYKEMMIEGNGAEFCDKNEAFKSLSPIDLLYFSHLHVGSNSGVFDVDVNYKDLLKDLYFEEKEETIVNYFENLKLYPHTLPSSDRDFYEEESYLRFIAKNYCKVGNKEPFSDPKSLILSTTRPIEDEKALCRFMLLGVDSLCGEGLYTFKLDDRNFLGAISALSFLDRSFYEKIETPEFVLLGTVINIEGDVSCVLTNSLGAKQELQLKKDQIFTYPLSSIEKVKVSLKSKKYSVTDKELTGGAFGIVIDTRGKFGGDTLTLEQRKEIIQEWEQTLLHSLRGF